MDLSAIERLSIPLLLRNTKHAVANERHSTASVIAHLAFVEHRRAYREAGYDSLRR